MTKPAPPQKAHPSFWAVGLFIVSSGFAAVAIARAWTDYVPF